MNDNHAEVKRFTNLPRAHLAKALLHENNIEAIILNQQDSLYQSFGDIIIFVPKTDLIRAKRLLEEF